MSAYEWQTKCPCGRTLNGSVKKPTLMTNTIRTITCKNCATKILMTCKRIKGVTNRLIRTEFELVYLSPLAREIKGAELGVKAKIVGEKIKSVIGIPTAGSREVEIETEMD